jgi:GH15 family glucan-1,4-alpha-glucosidase
MTLDGLAARSVAVIRAHQADSGAYLAAPFPAAYRNAWLRDGAFVADAMSRAGERASAEAFFSWCAGVVEARAGRMAAHEILDGRFTVDGTRCPAVVELDGYGAWVWAPAAVGGTASTPHLGFRPRGPPFDMPPIAGRSPASTGGRSGAGCMSRRSLPSTAG